MNLTPPELDTLAYYISDNLLVLMQLPNFEQIAGWVSIPTSGSVENLIPHMTPSDRYQFFIEQDFTKVYAATNLKLHEGNSLPVPTIYNQPDLSAQDKNLLCLSILSDLSDFDLRGLTMQNLILNLCKEGRGVYTTLTKVLRLLCMNGTLSYLTTNKMMLESNPEIPRWQLMGLSQPPTAKEIQDIFTT